MFKVRSVNELTPPPSVPAPEGITPINRPVSYEIGRDPIMILRSGATRSVVTLFVNAPPRDYTDTVKQLWKRYTEKQVSQGYDIGQTKVLIVGGSDHARWKANKMIAAATKGGSGDVKTNAINGAFYRTLRIDPASGEVQLKEAAVVAAHTNPGSASLTLDDDLSGFAGSSGGDVVANATRFFRHDKTFEALKERIVPQFLENRPDETFTLWSAACSNGTEAYSYAIYLHRLFTRLRLPPRFKILATDFNRNLVSFAQKGVYEPTKKDLETYRPLFTSYGVIDGKYIAFNDEIKRHITFKQYDLRKRPPAEKFCYIIAANVFQYYQADARATLLTNLCHALRPGGYLFANPYTPTMARASGLEVISRYQLYRLPRTGC